MGHQVRDVQDAFNRKGLIAKEIGDYPSLIQEANTVPVLVVPRLEEGTSDYLVKLIFLRIHSHSRSMKTTDPMLDYGLSPRSLVGNTSVILFEGTSDCTYRKPEHTFPARQS